MKYTRVILFAIMGVCFLAACKRNGNQAGDNTQKDSTGTDNQLVNLNKQIANDAQNASLLHERAKLYVALNQPENALKDMQKALSIDSTQALYYLTISDVYFMVNQTSESKRALEKTISLDTTNVEAQIKLAQLYYYVQKYDESITYVNKVLRKQPSNAMAYFIKGMIYKEMGDTSKAVSSFQTTVEQDQMHFNAYMQLAMIYSNRRSPLSVEYFKNCIRINPQSIEAWYALGYFQQTTRNLNGAIAAYTQVTKIDPMHVNANYNLGVIHAEELNVQQEAVKYFTKVIQANPKAEKGYTGLGYAYQRMGDVKKAEENYQTALRLNPQYQPALMGMQLLKK